MRQDKDNGCFIVINEIIKNLSQTIINIKDLEKIVEKL